MSEQQGAVVAFSRDQIDLIKRTVARDASDDELQLFLHQCRRTGLDPLAKQIYFRKHTSKSGPQVTIITAIDGYRLTADRTGLYAGNDDPIFDDEENPRRASVTVYKMIAGQRCAFTATARWQQYYPGDAQGFMWRKMPHLMLGKCAEALALRKAFPAELSGIYTPEEMAQAGVTEEPPAAKPTQQPRGRQPGFDPADKKHQDALLKRMQEKGVDGKHFEAIGEAMRGRHSADMDTIIDSVGAFAQ